MLAVVLSKILAAGRGATKIATGTNPNGRFDLRQFSGQFVGPSGGGGLSGSSFGSASSNAANEFRIANLAPQAARVATPPPSSR